MDREELKKLGMKFRSARLSRGLSQTRLAYNINKDHPSISRLERGKVNPTYLYLLDVCEGLEMRLDEVLTEF